MDRCALRPFLVASVALLALTSPGAGCGAHAGTGAEMRPSEVVRSTPVATADAPVSGAPAGGAEVTSGVFDVSAVGPYYASGRAADGVLALQAGRYDEARTHLEAAVLASGAKKDDVRLLFLLAFARVRSGKHAAAAAGFETLATRYPLLADYHHYYAALARANTLEPDRAVANAERVSEASVLHADAMLVAAEARMMAGEARAAATAFDTYIARYPRGPRVADASWHRGRLRKELGELAAARDAWSWIRAHTPFSARASEAEAELEKTGGLPTLSGVDLLTRGAVFHAAQKHDRAIDALDKGLKLLAAAGSDDPELAAEMCAARYMLARSLDRRRKRSLAAVEMAGFLTTCPTSERTESALYHAARLHLSVGKAKAALSYATRLETEFPDGRLADDALLFVARAHKKLGDGKKYEALVLALPERHPTGDMSEEALWNLAWKAYLAGNHEAAERYLDHAIASIPRINTYWGAGRPLYWKGRIRELAGDTTASRELYQRCIRTYPLSFYATLSVARLAAAGLAPAELEELLPRRVGDDTKPAAVPGGDGDTWTFPALEITKQPAFERGVELLRLGLTDAARKELATLTTTRGDAEQWLLAVLYDSAKAWRLSHNIPRRRIVGWDRHAPLSAWRKHWLVAYPDGFADEIGRGAADAAVPAALLFALVREESAFDPAIESWANAIGLTQLLLPTARGVAKGMARFKGVTITEASLRDPAINVPIGATFLGSLLKRWKNPLLAIGGYNAGGGAVKRWVEERGHLPMDEYIERIPYNQTRNYTKRVIASYATYRFLYEGTTLRLDLSPAK